MATVAIPSEQRCRLSDIPWPAYVAFCDGLGPRHIRVTYDQGEMEIMTVSHEHEHDKRRLSRLVETLTEELAMEIAYGGSMTCRQELLERGFEPDECYWISHEAAVRDLHDIDFDRDPPPDLAIEVEISRSTMNRLRLYASLGVPELWRWDGERLLVCLLGADGQYHDSDSSQAFPFLPLADLVRFLTTRGVGENQIVREFRKWVREQQAAGWGRKKARRSGGHGPAKGRRKSQ